MSPFAPEEEFYRDDNYSDAGGGVEDEVAAATQNQVPHWAGCGPLGRPGSPPQGCGQAGRVALLLFWEGQESESSEEPAGDAVDEPDQQVDKQS